MEWLEKIIILAPPLLIAVILHELAHGLVAERLGRNSIGIEISPEYVDIARRRIAGDK